MGIWNRLLGGMDVVRFTSGGYGVVKGWGFGKRFVDRKGDEWYTPEYVLKWARHDTAEEARDTRQKYSAKGVEYTEVADDSEAYW